MFNAQRLLGTMLGTGLGGRSHRSIPGGQPAGGGSTHDTGHDTGHGTGSGGGLMGAIGSLLGGGRRESHSGVGGGGGGGLATGGIAAVLGGLAMRYMQPGDQGQQTQGAGMEGGADGTVSDDQALRMVRAMIAAANADGRIDMEERRQIMGKLGEAGASEEDRSFLEREMDSPASVESLAQGVEDPNEKAEIYASALMAIDADTDAERAFLAKLGDRLGLPPQDRTGLHQSLGAPEPR